MSFGSQRRHHSSGRPSNPNRTRNLMLLGGILAVLLVAVVVPLALSSPPTTAVPNPTGTQQGLPLPNAPSMPAGPSLFPVGQSFPPGDTIPPADTPPPVDSLPPDESLPPGQTQGSGHTAPPNQGGGGVAVRIRVPSLGIDLPIIEGDGVDVPLYRAAHYPGSAWPGQGSNIYLYAHARAGMFLNLWDARSGDVVYLDLASGGTRTYVVDQVLGSVPWDDTALLGPTSREQLTLQTCLSYGDTAPRFVVIAHPSS
jgi:LPXTG-site transpeptidase (sortase) family protein